MSLCINPRCSKPHNPDDNLYCLACGSELLLMGRYRVTRLLSNKGGFGNTYEVMDKETPKVLKVLTNDHPHAIELFHKEAEVLNKLNHPGIPKGEGYFTYFPRNSQTPLHCLVMEKIEGMDLEEYQKQHQFKPIDENLALEWISQLASILHEVHRREFFHRDIKPSNIILKPDGQLTLIDFGAVRQVTGTIMAGGQSTGIFTVGYAPPEQQTGYAVPQSDFYALGRTFVYLLTGKEPNDSAIYDYKNNELNWRKYAPELHDNFADFIDQLMSNKVAVRPADTTILVTTVAKIKQEILNPSASPSQKTLSQNQTQTQTQQKTQVVPAKVQPSPKIQPASSWEYAGFWTRFNAAMIDEVVVMIVAGFLGGYLSFKLQSAGLLHQWNIYDNFSKQQLISLGSTATMIGTTFLGLIVNILGIIVFFVDPKNLINHLPDALHNPTLLKFLLNLKTHLFLLAPITLGGLIKWIYFVFSETFFKTTIGKKLFNLVVVDLNGKRLTLTEANERYWSKLLSAIPLYLGFMIAGWTHKKRALHDIIAGSMIIVNSNKNET